MAEDVIDWDLALATGTRLSPKGPVLSLEEAKASVAVLRDQANEAVGYVRECTGLVTPEDAPDAAVVDRSAWIDSNLESFRHVLHPVLNRLRSSSSSPVVTGVGSRLTAVQMGGVLAWMSGKVLGQYEALVPARQAPRLMLVAPNIVGVADQLGVDRGEFGLWVCLHEETHRVQFTAVDWLSDYFADQTRELVAAVDVPAKEMLRHSKALLAALAKVLRGGDGANAIFLAVLSEEQRRVYDRLSALMTLLEGHADVVMDEVGPGAVPSVETIRERFDRRRNEPGAFDSVARKVFGMDAKLRQYSEGALFVRAVVDKVGMDGFNQIWTDASTLPTLPELETPDLWIKRVHA